MDLKPIATAAAIALLAALALAAQPVTRMQLREMVRNLGDENREARLQEIYTKYAKPMRERLRKAQYRPGGENRHTKTFVFKETPTRDLKIYIDFPPGWEPTDKRAALVLWHGGGFTQGSASQFLRQCDYFTKRGMVCARPEYRVSDLDDALPHIAIEDGVSAMRWLKSRDREFGIDAERIAVGGGSAGGSMASVIGTLDTRQFAEAGFIGEGEDPNLSVKPAAMILYNPFVDFFEPLNARHIEEEMAMMGRDPREFEDLYHLISAIEQLDEESPPNIIMFGTRDAFYPQQIRWIAKSREMGLLTHDYVYKGEVHSWYNNSPHIEYTTANVDKFLQEVGLLGPEPQVELPHKRINPNRLAIQESKYADKTDWDEQQRFQRFVREHEIELIPYKHYEK